MRVPVGAWSFSVNTYLNGQLQDASERTGDSANEERFSSIYITATKPFDAVELLVVNEDAHDDGPPQMKVLEICANLGFS